VNVTVWLHVTDAFGTGVEHPVREAWMPRRRRAAITIAS